MTKGERSGEPVLVVPRTALIDVAGKNVVFVRVSPGGSEANPLAKRPEPGEPQASATPAEFELHEVTSGDTAAGRVRILSGLREGEEIVVEGAFTIKSVILRGTLAGEE